MANWLRDSFDIITSPIHGRNGVKYDALGKATNLAECLEDEFMPNESDRNYRSYYKQVRRRVPFFKHISFGTSIKLLKSYEVRQVIKHLKTNKAPGYKEVTNRMIKQLPHHFVNHLVVIFNGTLKLQQFPDIWKKAEVVSVPKTGKGPKITLELSTI